MNIFSEVKEQLTTRQVAESYGLRIRKNGVACCPFHDDRHPSMKVDKNYHCFACGVGGDVIDYTARMYGLSQYDAAKKLIEDFGLHVQTEAMSREERQRLRREKEERMRIIQIKKKFYRWCEETIELLKDNNREFISNNVVPERTAWNRIYIQESLEQAYEKCFGQALMEYNAGQKRKDRRKENYLKEIENSGNKEKTFYENIVQIGKKDDTPVVGADGKLTEEAKAAIEILEQYAKTFQERNPNLYLFNCVMHLDEATPHLHIDYIPVANGYKTGMKTRNSLTKALQQMGFAKAVSKKENETVAWQQRERAYLTELCQEKGIDVEVLGIQRDNLTLPEYKAAMRKVEKLEHQAVEIEENNQRLVEQAEKLVDQIAKLDEKEKDNKNVLKKYDLRADTLKTIAKETEKDTKKLKSAAIPVSNIFGSEEYVKVKKSDWEKIIDAFGRAVSRNKLLEKYEKKIVALEKKVSDVSGLLDKMKQFISNRGLGEAFAEFVKSLEPKTMKERLTEKQKVVKEQTQQKSMHTQEHGTSRKHNISTEL